MVRVRVAGGNGANARPKVQSKTPSIMLDTPSESGLSSFGGTLPSSERPAEKPRKITTARGRGRTRGRGAASSRTTPQPTVQEPSSPTGINQSSQEFVATKQSSSDHVSSPTIPAPMTKPVAKAETVARGGGLRPQSRGVRRPLDGADTSAPPQKKPKSEVGLKRDHVRYPLWVDTNPIPKYGTSAYMGRCTGVQAVWCNVKNIEILRPGSRFRNIRQEILCLLKAGVKHLHEDSELDVSVSIADGPSAVLWDGVGIHPQRVSYMVSLQSHFTLRFPMQCGHS
eukprot:gene17766-789_t